MQDFGSAIKRVLKLNKNLDNQNGQLSSCVEALEEDLSVAFTEFKSLLEAQKLILGHGATNESLMRVQKSMLETSMHLIEMKKGAQATLVENKKFQSTRKADVKKAEELEKELEHTNKLNAMLLKSINSIKVRKGGLGDQKKQRLNFGNNTMILPSSLKKPEQNQILNKSLLGHDEEDDYLMWIEHDVKQRAANIEIQKKAMSLKRKSDNLDLEVRTSVSAFNFQAIEPKVSRTKKDQTPILLNLSQEIQQVIDQQNLEKSAIIPIFPQEKPILAETIKIDQEEKEAPLKILQEEIGQIVHLQQDLKIQSEILKDETSKLDDLLGLGTKFTQSTVEERQKLLDSSNLNSFDDIFAELINSSQSKIENTLFFLLLAAVQISSFSLGIVMENNNLRNQQQFDTFNPISFGPGICQEILFGGQDNHFEAEVNQGNTEAEILTLEDQSAKNLEEISHLEQALLESTQAEDSLLEQEHNFATTLTAHEEEIEKYEQELEALKKELIELESEEIPPVDAC